MSVLYEILYPPIMNSTYLPGFIYGVDKKFKIYYTMSQYNDIDKIKKIQVSIRDQRTNRSVKKEAGVEYVQKNFSKNNLISGNLYQFPVNCNEFNFEPNLFYKVQLRFLSTDNVLSEWSQVTLIKAVNNFTIQVNGLQNKQKSVLNYFLNNITGRINFIETENTINSRYETNQYLSKYRIKLKKDDQIIQDSQIITNSTTVTSLEFNYIFKTQLETNVDYVVEVWVQTNHQIEKYGTFPFSVSQIIVPTFPVKSFTAEPDSQGARIKLHLVIQESAFVGITSNKFIIKRACADTNYEVWQTIFNGIFNNMLEPVDIVQYDYTVEPGKFYVYAFQKQMNISGMYFEPTETKGSEQEQTERVVYIYPEDMFLITHNKQLKIKFNPQISNFNYVVSESKQETIGSQYPFIRRNANIRYRTFNISGLISYLSDVRENTMKASLKQDMTDTEKTSYAKFKNKYAITPTTDFLEERHFREKVMQFLYNNDVKLFKSVAEGNILVKLMNISLSPLNEIGRIVYSFTCTAYEIDQFNAQNCRKYFIQYNTIEVGEQPKYQYFLGQIRRNRLNLSSIYKIRDEQGAIIGEGLYPFSDKTNFYKDSTLSNSWTDTREKTYNYLNTMKQETACRFSSNEKIDKFSICYLKIEFSTPPYPILFYEGATPVMGYLIQIDDEIIFVNDKGIYEVIDESVGITKNIEIPQTMKTQTYPRAVLNDQLKNDWRVTGLITYIARYTTKPSAGDIEKSYLVKDVIGQYYGYYDQDRGLISDLRDLYYQEKRDDNGKLLFKRTLDSIIGIRFRADPGTHIFVRQYQDYGAEDHIIGSTGLLEFYDGDTNVRDFSFLSGKKLDGPFPIEEGSHHLYQFVDYKLNYPWYAFPEFLEKQIGSMSAYNSIDNFCFKLPSNLKSLEGKVGQTIGVFTVWPEIKTTGAEKLILIPEVYIIRKNDDTKRIELELQTKNFPIQESILSTTYFIVDNKMFFWTGLRFEQSGFGVYKQNVCYTITHKDNTQTNYQLIISKNGKKHFKEVSAASSGYINPQDNTIYKIINRDATDDQPEVWHYMLYYGEDKALHNFIKRGNQYYIDNYEFKGIIEYYCRVVERTYQ